MTSCPCCSSQLLRHMRGSEIYWFCRNCWQEMPQAPRWEALVSAGRATDHQPYPQRKSSESPSGEPFST